MPDPAQLAVLAGVPESVVLEVLDDDDAYAELEAFADREEANGNLLPVIADQALLMGAKTIRDKLKECKDAFDAAELMKPLLRLRELETKKQLSDRDIGPLVTINLDESFMTRFGLLKRRPVHVPVSETVEVVGSDGAPDTQASTEPVQIEAKPYESTVRIRGRDPFDPANVVFHDTNANGGE